MTPSSTAKPPISAASGAPSHGLEPLSRRYKLLVWLPLILTGVGAAACWHFVSFAFLSNPGLNGSIAAVMGWGVWTMIGHVGVLYKEDAVFRAGMAWLRTGSTEGGQDPRFGPHALVTGMLERLGKLGLGHQVYVHTSAMEPEIESLAHHFERQLELSQVLVGLMVGLGLLCTFIGLLETLVQTSELIGTIAKSAGGGGGNMEEEFAKIVGGLQGPLSAMGTAFSASMFGLVGSIMLGFQLVVVRKTATDFVEQVRGEVLSLAESSKISAEVEISERFLATLLADILEQHKETTRAIGAATDRMAELVPEMRASATASAQLAERVRAQEEVLETTARTVGSVAQVLPALGQLVTASSEIMVQAGDTGARVEKMLGYMPGQEALLGDLRVALKGIASLTAEVRSLKQTTDVLRTAVSEQGATVRRLDRTLWNEERQSLLDAVEREPELAVGFAARGER